MAIHRQFHAQNAYHVISRGSGKQTVFKDPADYETYLRILRWAKERHDVEVFHYVLMPNHVHLLVRPRRQNGSRFMQYLNSKYAKYFCERYKKIGHVWKNRFKSLVIESDAYLMACGNYIEMNPVRAMLTKKPEQWPYSSYRHYSIGTDDGLVDGNPMYADFGKTKHERRSAYKKWIGKTRAGDEFARPATIVGL